MKKIALVVLAFVAIGVQAAGPEDGFYAGLNSNHVKFTCDNCTGATGNGIGVYGGYRMGNLAGEVSNFQKTISSVDVVITDVSVLPRFNVANNVDLLGKVGVRYSKGTTSTQDKSGTSLVVGAGVEYTIVPQISLRALVDYSADTFGISTHTTTTSIGMAYKF